MDVIDHMRFAVGRASRQILVPVLGLALTSYFGYHAVQGDRGLINLMRLQDQIREARTTRDQLRQEREDIEKRTALLRPGHIDPDLLDERARLLLNFTHPDDLIILRQKIGPASQEK